jgi:phytoene dehydrogenase-like protein
VPGFATYYCATAAPQFKTPDGPRTAVSAGLAGWPEDFIQLGADLRTGRFFADPPWVLVATPTLADPGRAPAGQHTVKILSPQVYQPGPGGWAELKHEHSRRQLDRLQQVADFPDEAILASLVKSPKDIEELNPHMIHGAFHGGNRGPAFSGPLRPAPGWAAHRMPIPGLYQTGGSTHPGGSITGAPGRNAAIVMLSDLGHDPAEVMSSAGHRPVTVPQHPG